MSSSANGRASLVTVWGRQSQWRGWMMEVKWGPPARDAGVLEDEEVEWAVTALFIQCLNSLGGEAEKCQREEDDYEISIPFPSPNSEHSSSSCLTTPRGLRRQTLRDRGRKEGGIEGGCSVPLIHPFLLLMQEGSWFFFCWQYFRAIQIMLTKGPFQTWAVITKSNDQQRRKNWTWAMWVKKTARN